MLSRSALARPLGALASGVSPVAESRVRAPNVAQRGEEAKMKVLVMGGTQFNGLALVRELVRTGHDVSVLNRGKTDA